MLRKNGQYHNKLDPITYVAMLDEAFTVELREVTGHTPEVNKCYRNINLTRQVETLLF